MNKFTHTQTHFREKNPNGYAGWNIAPSWATSKFRRKPIDFFFYISSSAIAILEIVLLLLTIVCKDGQIIRSVENAHKLLLLPLGFWRCQISFNRRPYAIAPDIFFYFFIPLSKFTQNFAIIKTRVSIKAVNKEQGLACDYKRKLRRTWWYGVWIHAKTIWIYNKTKQIFTDPDCDYLLFNEVRDDKTISERRKGTDHSPPPPSTRRRIDGEKSAASSDDQSPIRLVPMATLRLCVYFVSEHKNDVEDEKIRLFFFFSFALWLTNVSYAKEFDSWESWVKATRRMFFYLSLSLKWWWNGR